jgi:hypothetical protein
LFCSFPIISYFYVEKHHGMTKWIPFCRILLKKKNMTNEERWMEHYSLLKKYVSEHGHLPDKKKVENRGLLNWWKYNKKRAKQGLLPLDRLALLKTLSDMRLTVSKDHDLFGDMSSSQHDQ